MPLAALMAVALTSCAEGRSTPSAQTSPPSTVAQTSSTSTSTSTQVPALLETWAAAGHGGAAVAIATSGGPVATYTAGVGGTDGRAVEEDSGFRIGSLTKSFVAVMVLQAIDEQGIGLDTEVADLIAIDGIDGIDADGITIRQLLGHRTGLAEHTDGELAPAVLADPRREWTAGDVMALIEGQPPEFDPGQRFQYSNTNYVVAGLLLESVTGSSIAENLRTRLVEPLSLNGTYFPPAEGRRPITGFSPSLPGGSSEASPYTALETAAGAAGGLVSTATDVATFIRALGDGALLPPDLFKAMVADLDGPDGAGLGVFAADPPSATGISNAGAIPGFVSYMHYDPAADDLLVMLLNDDGRSAEALGFGLQSVIEAS